MEISKLKHECEPAKRHIYAFMPLRRFLLADRLAPEALRPLASQLLFGDPLSCAGGCWIGHFPQGVGLPIANAWVVGGRLWLTGFPLCFCEKYGKLARTDLKNERISRSGGFQACYEIIRGVVGGLNSS
jgi:hypothetical protein